MQRAYCAPLTPRLADCHWTLPQQQLPTAPLRYPPTGPTTRLLPLHTFTKDGRHYVVVIRKNVIVERLKKKN